MIALACLLLALPAPPADLRPPPPADTLRLEVGSPEVDGRILPPHRARNRVYRPGETGPAVEWTNELTLGDSAGMRVMRWVTRGRQLAGGSAGTTWELLQTYDARTLAPLAYSRSSSDGSYLRLTLDGGRVRGVRRAASDPRERPVDQVLDRRGFIASASDLVPMAVGLREGVVMTAPIWGPGMEAAETRVFAVLGEETVEVEGEDVRAWRVEERLADGGRLIATWWLTESSPYMVYAEIPLADGGVQRMTGVALDGR